MPRLDTASALFQNTPAMAPAEKSRPLREIARACAASSDARDILRFLNSLLTPSEIAEISSRWELVKRLERGDSQRQIARQLGLSLCKITRGSRELKKKDAPFKRMLAVLEKQKQGRALDGNKKRKT